MKSFITVLTTIGIIGLCGYIIAKSAIHKHELEKSSLVHQIQNL